MAVFLSRIWRFFSADTVVASSIRPPPQHNPVGQIAVKLIEQHPGLCHPLAPLRKQQCRAAQSR
jgi:hypothetical protein